MPQSIDSEKLVLGTLMTDRNALNVAPRVGAWIETVHGIPERWLSASHLV